MAFSTYNEFRVAFQLLLDGDEVAGSILPETLDLMISLGEAMVHYGDPDGRVGPLRASSMEASLSVAVAANAVALPADCMELVTVYFDGEKPLDVVQEQDLRDRLKWMTGGPVRKCAQAGDSLIFSPTAADGTTLLGRYYAKPEPLAEGLHVTFNRYPELYLYAALSCAAPFLGDDARIPVWQGFYRSLLSACNMQERLRAYNGSRLRQVAR